jgi:hypothetical protein
MPTDAKRRNPDLGAKPCPKCGNERQPKRPSFTWWGGVLGPKLLNHAICSSCGTGFNAKTGKSNTGPIVAYTAVILFIVLVLAAVFASTKK